MFSRPPVVCIWATFSVCLTFFTDVSSQYSGIQIGCGSPSGRLAVSLWLRTRNWARRRSFPGCSRGSYRYVRHSSRSHESHGYGRTGCAEKHGEFTLVQLIIKFPGAHRMQFSESIWINIVGWKVEIHHDFKYRCVLTHVDVSRVISVRSHYLSVLTAVGNQQQVLLNHEHSRKCAFCASQASCFTGRLVL